MPTPYWSQRLGGTNGVQSRHNSKALQDAHAPLNSLSVFDKSPHESLIKMSNCASQFVSTTAPSDPATIICRVCIAVSNSEVTNVRRLGLQWVASKTLSCLQRIFLR